MSLRERLGAVGIVVGPRGDDLDRRDLIEHETGVVLRELASIPEAYELLRERLAPEQKACTLRT